MIDQWFDKDLEKIYEQHSIAVVIDESGQAGFLLDTVKGKYHYYSANNDIEEISVKFEVEKVRNNGEKVLIFTSIPREKLVFIREFTETDGCVEIKHLYNYVKHKVHKHTGYNLQLDNNEIISAAKISVGKGKDYWIDLGSKGSSELFNLEKELVPFLADPDAYMKALDPVVREQFLKRVNDLLDQPNEDKPINTLTNEVAAAIFQGLINNKQNPTLKKVYLSWIDSVKHQKAINAYVKDYQLPQDIDILKVSSDHPFESIDQTWIKEIGLQLNEREAIKKWIPLIKKRTKSAAEGIRHLGYWKDFGELLSFDISKINSLKSLPECIQFYTSSFWKVDRAVRNLYTHFLNQEKLLTAYQNYYKDLLNVFLEKWFSHFKDYAQTQTGALEKIIKEKEERTAIIVGDGVNYEIARNVIAKVDKAYKSFDGHMLANIPSVTENNMSQLYLASGEVKKVHGDREKALLKALPNKDIGFISLEEISDTTDKHHYLVCTYKDIDDMGEKLQQGALKFIDGVEDTFVEKIEQLLNNGYQKVFLVTDHGFVLTGILGESDKVTVDFKDSVSKSERFVQTAEKQEVDKRYFVEVEKQYKGFNYLYFSKSVNPFKTPGRYGYSHGGILPQELIIPFISWEQTEIRKHKLKVNIGNKPELEEVVGDIFEIQLQPEMSINADLFTAERKVMIHFYAAGKLVNKSDIISVRSGSVEKKEYQFEKNQEFETRLVDADSKELLDKCTVKKSVSRDLGGLL